MATRDYCALANSSSTAVVIRSVIAFLTLPVLPPRRTVSPCDPSELSEARLATSMSHGRRPAAKLVARAVLLGGFISVEREEGASMSGNGLDNAAMAAEFTMIPDCLPATEGFADKVAASQLRPPVMKVAW